MMIDSILVPKDRINVIKDHETREKLEKSANVKLTFEENSVLIDGEGIDLLTAKNIVRAIGRGFAPDKAFRLLKEDELLEIIDIDYEPNKAKIIKARLIGTGGKTRRMIEEFSGSSMSVYGKTVCIIGKYEQNVIAREAIVMLLEGSRHANVYKFLFEARPS
jgi:ribosomal RNA assembly protein